MSWVLECQRGEPSGSMRGNRRDRSLSITRAEHRPVTPTALPLSKTTQTGHPFERDISQQPRKDPPRASPPAKSKRDQLGDGLSLPRGVRLI